MPETGQYNNSQVEKLEDLANKVKFWGNSLGFQQVAIVKPDLEQASKYLKDWLEKGYQGSMEWMAEHGDKRYCVDKLVEHTVRVITVRMDYLADDKMIAVLKDNNKAYISRYALGRDYHKLIRRRLAELVNKIKKEVPSMNLSQRPFVDSAPVMEKPLAEQAGLGWIGKNTLLLNRDAGSWFFLGEIYTSLALPEDNLQQPDRCGNCRACLKICPTDAFPEPYVLDARKCISYLTIENKGSIPEELRPKMGNRVFGCDDCQIICPWNRYANLSMEADFSPRHNLDNAELLTLFQWNEEEFLSKTEGSPIRRIGYQRWLRNLAIGLGNAEGSSYILELLEKKTTDSSVPVSDLAKEHIDWAIEEQRRKLGKSEKKHKTTTLSSFENNS